MPLDPGEKAVEGASYIQVISGGKRNVTEFTNGNNSILAKMQNNCIGTLNMCHMAILGSGYPSVNLLIEATYVKYSASG